MLFIYSTTSDYLFQKNTDVCGLKTGVKGYRVKTIHAGNITEIECYPIWNTGTGSRAKKAEASSLAQEYRNERNSQKRLIRLLNTNFNEHDCFITLTYDRAHLPPDYKAAQKEGAKFIRRLRRLAGKDLRYIMITETYSADGEIVRAHHHIVSSYTDAREMFKLWTNGKRNDFKLLDPDEHGLTGLGHYLTKENKCKRKEVLYRQWSSSRNLKKPKETISDHKLTRRAADRLAKASEGERREFFERMTKHKYIYTACEIRYSDIVAGAYIYARMRR